MTTTPTSMTNAMIRSNVFAGFVLPATPRPVEHGADLYRSHDERDTELVCRSIV